MNDVSLEFVEQSKRYITIDWLTASFNINLDVHDFIGEILFMDYHDFEFEVGGLARSYRYGNTAKFGDIHIYYSNNLDVENGLNAGFTINFRGQGCRQFESYRWSDGSWCWYDTIKTFLLNDCKFTRLDIALDLINTKYTWQFLLEKIYQKTLIFRGDVRRHNKINTKTGEDYHASIYIGSKPQQLNVYDKKGERFDRAGQEFDVENWIRWELRLSGEKAHLACIELENGRSLSDLFCGVLRAHYRFVTRTGDKNLSRRNDARWWLEFLGNAVETKLYVDKDKPTLKKKENWLEKHGPDKSELMLYLKDYFVYGSAKAFDKLTKRIQRQSYNLTVDDLSMILQGVYEECSNAGVISKYSKNQIIEELHKIQFRKESE